ncbi:MAG TPA: biopolymer transporter ExbD [Planctomycetaceae bacterium]|nr:biopolymer transporter ExbD [Planctomycetaceae bacterium]
MSVKIDKGTALGALSLTPLIDVIFLLLIFFLVATKFAEEERELDVQLPDATEARPQISEPRELFINIDKDGRYFVTGKILTLEELYGVLKQAWINNPGRASVVIRADKRCTIQPLVSAMDACNKAHIREYTITTRSSGS